MTYYSPTKKVIARKQHRCTNCGEAINAGETYMSWQSVDDGWFNNKMHPECLESLIDDADGGHFEYVPFSGERPR